MAAGGGGGGAAPPPKQDELQPHPVKDQLPNISFCITSPPPWPEAILLGFQHYLVMLGTTVLIPSNLVPQMGGGNVEKAKVIQTLLFVAGLNTLTQTFFGTRLPRKVQLEIDLLFLNSEAERNRGERERSRVMGCSKISFSAAAMVVVVLMATTTTRVAEGQPTASCASKLTPCANYLNVTKPPATCCDPLRQAVNQDLQCLCNLFNTPGFLESIGINVTDALGLAGRCNVTGNLSSCATSASAPSSPVPPATPGSDSNRVSIASAGMPSILLFWASMMLY